MNVYPQIGQQPAPALVELAEQLRGVANRMLRVHDGADAEVRHVLAALGEIEARLDRIATGADAPRVVDSLDASETRPYYFPGALAPRVHVGHPWMSGEATEGGRRGRVRFDLMHEGPPGLAHGGFVAWLFDQVFGQHAVATGFRGPTHRLEVVYRRGTPLWRVLDYTLTTESVDERKLFANAVLRDGETVLAESKALFVAPAGGFSMPSVD